MRPRTPSAVASKLVMKTTTFAPVRIDGKRHNRKVNVCRKIRSLDPEEHKEFDQRLLGVMIMNDMVGTFGDDAKPNDIHGYLRANGDAIGELGLERIPSGKTYIIKNSPQTRLACLEWLGANYFQSDLFDPTPPPVKIKHRNQEGKRPIRSRKFTVHVDSEAWKVKMEIWKVSPENPNHLDAVISCSEFSMEVTYDTKTGTVKTVFDNPVMRLIARECLRWWSNTLVSDLGPTKERLTKAKADYLTCLEVGPHTRHPTIKRGWGINKGKPGKGPFLVHACIANSELLTTEELIRWSKYIDLVNKEVDEWTALNGLDRGKFKDWLVHMGFRHPHRNRPGASIDPNDPD